MRMIVISSMDEHGKIDLAGDAGPIVDGEYRSIDGRGPYHMGFMFVDTAETRQLYSDYIAREKARQAEHGKDMYSTLNAMRRASVVAA